MDGTVKHVIWDLDGTLLDTYPAIVETLLKVLAEHGVTGDPAGLRRLLSGTFNETVEGLARQHGLSAAGLHTAYAGAHDEARHLNQPAFEGAPAALRAVRASGGLNLLATHRDRAGTRTLLERAGLWPLLDDLASVSDGHARKPDGQLFQVLLNRHGLHAAEVLAVGDRRLDMDAGRAAGCRTALIGDAAAAADLHFSDLAAFVAWWLTDRPTWR